jgi:hypothetical protein
LTAFDALAEKTPVVIGQRPKLSQLVLILRCCMASPLIF